MNPRTNIEHHGLTKYTHGCRCEECRDANRRYQIEWRRRKKAGLPTRGTIWALAEPLTMPRLPAFVTSVEVWLEEQRRRPGIDARNRLGAR